MKSFKDIWEIAANAVGSGGVSLPADAVHDKKKKKVEKRVYDGRTKEARQFYKRMETLRAKRESKLAKKVFPTLNSFR